MTEAEQVVVALVDYGVGDPCPACGGQVAWARCTVCNWFWEKEILSWIVLKRRLSGVGVLRDEILEELKSHDRR